MSSTGPGNIAPHSGRGDTLTLDVESANPHEENVLTADYYEILRVGQQADEETIERVYRTLADRFHPDNPGTGDPGTYLRLKEAYETLSNRTRRAEYNVMLRDIGGAVRFELRGREFFDGVRGGQNRRLALLCLLYRQRISNHQSPGLTILELEQLTGCTREEVTSALWYLCEKRWTSIGEFSAYSVTAEGFDFVERKLEDQLEFRALATWSYYGRPSELEDPLQKNDSLPLEIGPALNQLALSGLFGTGAESEGEIIAVDHYEILGIGPQADEESIERVYRTLAGRFHPDNPSTGDAKTFLRIREAFEILSDQTRRRQYDDLRQRTRYSGRFRLRSREFFEGMRGEQLRRLAVLCILYRQAASELPGLTVLDLEQLTGCTREELGSALWYLREKRWAKYGEFTQYSITAAGFDVVENKLETRETVDSRAWPRAGSGNGFMYSQFRALQTSDLGQQLIPVAPQALLPESTVSLENLNSHLITGSVQAETKAEETLNESVEAAQQPTPIEITAVAEPECVPVAPPALLSQSIFVPEIQDSHPLAEGEQAEVKNEEVSDIAERVTRLAAIAEQLVQSYQYTTGTPELEIPDMAFAFESEESVRWMEVGAEEPREDQPAVTPISAATDDTPEIAAEAAPITENVAQVDSAAEALPGDLRGNDSPGQQVISASSAPQVQDSGNFVEIPPPGFTQSHSSRPGFLRRFLRLGTDSAVPDDRHVRVRRQSILDIGPESWSPQLTGIINAGIKEEEQQQAEPPAVESEQPPVDLTPVAEILDEPEEVTPVPIQNEVEASDVAEPVTQTEISVQPEAEYKAPEVTPRKTAVEVTAFALTEVTPQSPGVSGMTNSTNAVSEQPSSFAVKAEKRVIFSMGGKGGVGKTSVMTGLAEWFEENRIPVTLLDLDTENKAKGSLTHFFGGRVPKINIHTPAGLDAFVDLLAEDIPVILADMGAGAGQITHDWFDKMYPDVAEVGVAFTAIGVVTADPASVDSVLHWATALQNRVTYVVVENPLTEHADFGYWQDSDQAQEFRMRFQPAVVRLDNRLADLENATRSYGVTLGRVATRTTGAVELQKASLVMRAQSYRRRMFGEFDKVKGLLLP